MKKKPVEVAHDKRRRELSKRASADEVADRRPPPKNDLAGWSKVIHAAGAAPAPKSDHTTAIATALTESKSATGVLAKANAFVIINNNDYGFVVESIAEIKEKGLAVDALRRKWVDPLNGVIKSINEAFRPVSAALGAAEKTLKTKLVDFVNSQAVERDALIQDASTAVQTGPKGVRKADALLAAAEEKVVPRVTGVQMRTTWTGEVIDADAIPREYLIVDEAALRKATVTKGGDPGIPGWRAFPVSSASINVDEVLGRGAPPEEVET